MIYGILNRESELVYDSDNKEEIINVIGDFAEEVPEDGPYKIEEINES